MSVFILHNHSNMASVIMKHSVVTMVTVPVQVPSELLNMIMKFCQEQYLCGIIAILEVAISWLRTSTYSY